MMMVSALGLVFKATFKEYILEHLPIMDQVELFNDNSDEFVQAKTLFSQQYSQDCLQCKCREIGSSTTTSSSAMGTTRYKAYQPHQL